MNLVGSAPRADEMPKAHFALACQPNRRTTTQLACVLYCLAKRQPKPYGQGAPGKTPGGRGQPPGATPEDKPQGHAARTSPKDTPQGHAPRTSPKDTPWGNPGDTPGDNLPGQPPPGQPPQGNPHGQPPSATPRGNPWLRPQRQPLRRLWKAAPGNYPKRRPRGRPLEDSPSTTPPASPSPPPCVQSFANSMGYSMLFSKRNKEAHYFSLEITIE